jgi:hypothetical protein
VRIGVPDAGAAVADAAAAGANLRRLDGQTVTVALDETTELPDVDALLRALNGGKDPGFTAESLAGEVRARGARAGRPGARRRAGWRSAMRCVGSAVAAGRRGRAGM